MYSMYSMYTPKCTYSINTWSFLVIWHRGGGGGGGAMGTYFAYYSIVCTYSSRPALFLRG